MAIGYDRVPEVVAPIRRRISAHQPNHPGPELRPRNNRYQVLVKPALDRALGLVLFLLALPVLAATALTVLLAMGRPVLYRQTRVGLHGRPFEMLKFRSMEPDRRCDQRPFHGPDRRRTHKTPDDPRHTRVGRFLREYSLDELPQLWNVLRGDLSLVGPRPELADIVDRYEPWQHQRHAVKPGVTGLWQVTERGNGLMHQHVEVDLRYLRVVSLRTDLKILLLTIPVMLGVRRGA
jgi:lipopolysaccharide/colanic/teichoic acid biosynthesis glycosyltransferase